MAAVTDDTVVVGIQDLDFKTRTIAVHLPKMSDGNSEDTVRAKKRTTLPCSDKYTQILVISINNTMFSTISDSDTTLVEDGHSTTIDWNSEITGFARPCSLLVRFTPRSPGSATTSLASIKGFQGNYHRKHGHRAQEIHKVDKANILDELDKENRPPVAKLLDKFKNKQF